MACLSRTLCRLLDRRLYFSWSFICSFNLFIYFLSKVPFDIHCISDSFFFLLQQFFSSRIVN